MTYSSHSQVRPIAGRLALDFVNTANWTDTNLVLHEKIETISDLETWAKALGLQNTQLPTSVEAARTFRSNLRTAFLDPENTPIPELETHLFSVQTRFGDAIDGVRRQPLLGLIAVSALSIFSDVREVSRVKICPGTDCGWLFLDETKNARRKWCIMETCGNRAKASRNYARKKQTSKARQA